VLDGFVVPSPIVSISHILTNDDIFGSLLKGNTVLPEEMVNHGMFAASRGPEHKQRLACLVFDETNEDLLLSLVLGGLLI
jgi:hypothetical protein